MSDSILVSVKKILGIAEDYSYFDVDILMHINSVMMILSQMGIGPKTPLFVEDNKATWSDLMLDAEDIPAVKSYVALKVKMLFDPPVSSQHATAINENLKELEWRLYSANSSNNFELREPAIQWEDWWKYDYLNKEAEE